MVEVWTARISTRDSDAFNITRKTGCPTFAPSWPLVRTALTNGLSAEELWQSYARSYLREMSISYHENRPEWEALLARPRVVLTCYCTDPSRCHRTLLGRILERLGASFKGELEPPKLDTTLFDEAMEQG